MHSMGFDHEQQRYDRDLYISINWDNMYGDNKAQFEKLPRTLAFPKYDFDFKSLLMYDLFAFSVPGKPSMTVLVRVIFLSLDSI